MLDVLFAQFDWNEAASIPSSLPLPAEYLRWMALHNGGEGPVGETAYACLYPLEELEEVNREYEADKWWPGFVIFGSDGGGILLGYRPREGLYCAVDACSADPRDRFYESDTLEGFFRRMDAND